MDSILRYFPNLTDRQKSQFAQLQPLYADWNEKVNVISRKDIDNLYVNHVLHSLSIARLVTFVDGTRMMDVGTGGGFPGIPLAILFPNCQFYLVDSIGKKIAVVKAVAEALGLTNVTAEQIRVEQVKTQFDFVLSRAVTRFDAFYNMTRKCVQAGGKNSIANGILYLKGGDIEEELRNVPKNWKRKCTPITKWFAEPYFVEKYVIHLY